MDGGQHQTGTTEVGWRYNGSARTIAAPSTNSDNSRQDSPVIEWTASEYVAHHKGIGWYLVLALMTIVVTGLIFLVTKEYIALIVMPILGILLGVLGAQKPRSVAYRLDETGLTVGNQFHSYQEFKAFALLEEGPFSYITFVPIKRFAISQSVYFDPKDQRAILGVLGNYLPMENRKVTLFDELLLRLRF